MPAAAIEALDATVRAACERVRDRVNDLKAGAVPANDVDDVAFELEKDIDRADAALLDLRAALLASSSPSTTTNADAAASSSRATPPVAAYRASLEAQRRQQHGGARSRDAPHREEQSFDYRGGARPTRPRRSSGSS